MDKLPRLIMSTHEIGEGVIEIREEVGTVTLENWNGKTSMELSTSDDVAVLRYAADRLEHFLSRTSVEATETLFK